MIIWSGWGILTIVFFVAAAVIGVVLQPVLDTSGLSAPNGAMAIGLVVAAILNWVVGRRLNNAPGRELIDAKTGERVVLRRRHRLFWVPMQYYSVLMVALAIGAIVAPWDTSAPPTEPT